MEYLVVKDGDLFLLTDLDGNIHPDSEKGLYTHDTRCLERYVLKVNRKPLVRLHSTCEQNYVSTIYLTNGEERRDGEVVLKRETIEVKREQIVRRGVFYERITFHNYGRHAAALTVSLEFASSFTDLFEARGAVRSRRGTSLPPVVEVGRVVLGYAGLDGIVRSIRLTCSEPAVTSDSAFEFHVTLRSGEHHVTEVVVQPVVGGEAGEVTSFDVAHQELVAEHERWLQSCTEIATDNPALNQLVERSLNDLHTLLTDLGDGPFPVAGIPWFAVPFGRDSLITALQMLPFQPEVARGTLRTLARRQGRQLDEWRAEEPGKILHEMRRGEMSNLGEVPFRSYYGSIDGTPLFIILAVEYFRWTGDRAFIQEILPNLLRAVEWLDRFADVDGDGLVEYDAGSGPGLSVQSWKDSDDSMIFPDGRIGESPMAVSEVQGYVYHAKQGLAELLPEFGESVLAARLAAEAAELKRLFNQRFWMEDRQYFAIALDKEKRQIPTIASDPGHCLWSGIVDADKVDALVRTLMSSGMFSGWGIRTLSADEPVFNPFSYHNGSVWAHDNSIILLGLAEQGQTAAVNQLTGALLRASMQFPYQRLPELFCGYSADLGYVVKYPVACTPQAWAAGTPLVMIRAILRPRVDVDERRVILSPTWPAFVSSIRVRNMPVGDTRISFSVDRAHGLTVHEANGYKLELVSSETATSGVAGGN